MSNAARGIGSAGRLCDGGRFCCRGRLESTAALRRSSLVFLRRAVDAGGRGGSGACAALVAAARRGLTSRKAEVILDGGTLTIEWLRDGHVMMTGGIAQSFAGTLDPSLLA